MAPDIFDGCEDGDEDISKIEIDRDYARRLEHNKRREALHRYEDLKKKGLAPSSSGESSSDESSPGELAGSRRSDSQFFDALIKVKRRDPIIYQKDSRLFSSSGEDTEGEDGNGNEIRTVSKKKPLYIKDVMAKQLIEKGPELEDEKPLKFQSQIYNKEQAEGIHDFLEGMGEDEDDVDFMKEKEVSKESMKDVDGIDGEIKQKIDDYFGDDEKLDECDMFMKKYFYNELWIDNDKDIKPEGLDAVGVSEDEEELDTQDRYESEYNFRHQELGAADAGDRVWGHSRFTEGSVRKKKGRHKLQRESKKERMALVKREQEEELKQLKNLKKKEIQEKLNRIRRIAGIGEGAVCNLNEGDLEEDFDPMEYDKRMKEMFGGEYYDAKDADPEFESDHNGELEKPDFDKEDELLGLTEGSAFGGSHEGFAAAREKLLKKRKGEVEDEPMNTEVKRKKKKQKISLQEKVALDKELEGYFKLDYEDTIGDLKTRFKYKSVPPNRYGLSTNEILEADDKALNQYVSVKKLAPYREEWKVTRHQKQKKDMILRGENLDRKKLKKKHKLKEVLSTASPSKITELEEMHGGDKGLELRDVEGGDANVTAKKNRRKRRRADLKLSHSRLAAYGKILSKSSKKHK